VSVLEFALRYREQGLAVLPLDGKQPHTRLIKRTHGRAAASIKRLAEHGSTDDQVREWFSQPDVNVGIFCGEASGGLVVVDFDDCEFPLRGARLPLTPTVKTGRAALRGYHLYYRTDIPVPCQSFEWGEVRGWTQGAPVQVTAPPSVHPKTGLRYGWPLSIGEVPFADFSSVELPGLAAKAASPQPFPLLQSLHPLCPTKAVLLGPCTTRDTGRDGRLQSCDRDEGAVRAMARALGITAALGHPFTCVLHRERNASASLHSAYESGDWLYHDFHAGRHGSPEWLTLAQVRAMQAGRGPKLSPSEHATWKLILLAEAGLLPPMPVAAQPLPAGVNGVVLHVYERILFVLGCRWNYTHGAPMPLERNFVAAICEVPERLARFAIDQLQDLGSIYVAEYHGRTRLWLPTSSHEAPTAHPLTEGVIR
jgi:Bifunctional DNA primase/polymerase, N-terminal